MDTEVNLFFKWITVVWVQLGSRVRLNIQDSQWWQTLLCHCAPQSIPDMSQGRETTHCHGGLSPQTLPSPANLAYEHISNCSVLIWRISTFSSNVSTFYCILDAPCMNLIYEYNRKKTTEDFPNVSQQRRYIHQHVNVWVGALLTSGGWYVENGSAALAEHGLQPDIGFLPRYPTSTYILHITLFY